MKNVSITQDYERKYAAEEPADDDTTDAEGEGDTTAETEDNAQ